MKILAFAASNSRASINRDLVDLAVTEAKSQRPELVISTANLNDFEIPILSTDRERDDGIPQLAHDFRALITDADSIIVSFPETNGNVSAASKNIFDWVSRIDMNVWQDKPMVILSASPGPNAGQGVLGAQEAMAPFFGGNIVASHCVGIWHEAYDAELTP